MKAEIRELFQNRNYRKSLSAELINRFGDSVDAIASSWIVYEITGQASWSALIYALNRIPTIILTPLAGPWVERQNKKLVMVITDLIRAICVGLLATGLLMGFLSAQMIAVLNLVISSAEAFRVPAGTAIFPQIVPDHLYGEAMSINKAASGTVELIGTAFAAVYFILVGASPLYTNYYVALGFLVVLTAILGLFITIANMFLGIECYRIIDKEYLARTSSIGNALGSAIMPVTAGLISGLLKFSNVAQIFLGAGIVAIVFCIVLIAKGNLDEQENTDTADTMEAA